MVTANPNFWVKPARYQIGDEQQRIVIGKLDGVADARLIATAPSVGKEHHVELAALERLSDQAPILILMPVPADLVAWINPRHHRMGGRLVNHETCQGALFAWPHQPPPGATLGPAAFAVEFPLIFISDDGRPAESAQPRRRRREA